MTEKEEKPKLMVEDASSVECVGENGDKLVRTADRAGTVKKLKENTAGPQPLHD